jgi:hypothetical protein
MPDGSHAAPQREAHQAPPAPVPASQQKDVGAPPKPAPGITDPRLALTANAPVRAAALRDMQRGMGNQAVQDAVAGVGGRAAARKEPTPREQDAAEDMQAMPPEGEEAGAEPPPPLPPLTGEPLRDGYEAPVTIGPDVLSFPHHARSAAQEAEARSAAEASYAALRGEAGRRHDATLNDANRAMDEAARAYAEAAARLDAFEQRCGAEIDTMQQMATLAIDQSADTAIQRGQAAHDASVKALATIARESHGRVGGMQALADHEGKAVVADAVKQYTDAFEKAKTDVKDQEKAAEKGLTDWLPTVDKAYPMKFDDLQRAQAEARRKAAPQLVTDDTKRIQTSRDNIITEFDKALPGLTAQVGKTLQEQIDKNTKAAIGKGHDTVETARKQAVAGLERQLHDGVQAVEQMRRSGQAAVRADAAAARLRVAAVVRARKSALRSNASTAMEGVTTGVQPALRLYAASPDRLTNSFRSAARRGAEAVRQAAHATPPGIRAAMDNAQRLHAERSAANAASMNGMLTREEQQCAAEAEQELARSRLRIDQSSGGAMQQIDGNAAEQRTAFTQITEDVHATAESWATAYGAGMSASSAAYRKAAGQSFSTFMTGNPPPVGEGSEKAKPFNETLSTIKAEFDRRLRSDSIVALFEPAMAALDKQVKERLTGLANGALAAAENGNGGQLTQPLRDINATEGSAIIQLSATLGNHTALDEYMLLQVARGTLDSDDYKAAMAYLRGNKAEGASYEIKSSLGFWSDDKQRIEGAMRNLTPEQLAQLDPEALEQARGWWHLGGTDLQVFNALAAGDVPKADAIRAIQQVDKAKYNGEYDKLNASLTTAFGATTYGGKQVSADQHRKEVQAKMASILRSRQTANAASDTPPDTRADTAVIADFVTEKVEVPVGAGESSATITLQIDGANKDLALAIINKGPDSPAAQTARLGVEYQRPDGPTIVKLDTALVDERLNPQTLLTEDGKQKTGEALARAKEDRETAQKERDAVIVDFARTYLKADPNIKAEDARKLAAEKFGDKIGPDSKGGSEYVSALFTEGYVSPETAARGMSYAMYSSFWHTDKDLMRQIVSRMNADEITRMRGAFQGYTGKDLYDELGVYHHGGFFTTLSGDTRLEFERLLLGQPRNDFERAQRALFTIEQQRRETGAVGKFLAGGSYAEAAMEQTRAELIGSLGGTAEVDSEGHLKVPAGIFGTGPDDRGQFRATDRGQFDLAVSMSKAVAENYAARIDSIASSVTMAIAVIGAVIAAVVTVATGGAAAPLLMGAIALTAGLAGMGAHRLISGGRYGWHEAARDFGMTLVQAITAGVGAQLGALSRGGFAAIEAAQAAEEAAAAGIATTEQLAARGGAEMGQILGSKAADMALIGVTTGAMTGAGQALFNEKTWEKGGLGALQAMLEGTIRGALAGLATSVATQAVEAVPLRAGPGGSLGEIMGGLGRGPGNLAWQSVGRAALKSITSSVGAMAGRSVEVGWDKAAGRFSGSAAEEIVHAGAFAALQGGLEGMAEAPAERWRAGQQAARVRALREQGEAASAEPPKPPPHAVPSGVEAELPRVLPIEAPPLPRVQPVAPPAEMLEGPQARRPGVPRAPGPEEEALAGRPGAPRTAGAPPEGAEPPAPLRFRGDIALLPEETVIRPPNATSIEEAHEIYGNVIADQPDREAAIYRNPATGELIVIQGEATTVGVRAAPGGELEAPGAAGTAQRWKELLEGPDSGRWELVAHFHPADQAGGGISLPARMPSGSPGDFQVMEGESALSGTARQSRIHYLDKGAWGHTDFGYDPASPKARYWVDHADAVGGGRTRVEFESLDQYREWFHSSFNRAPDTTSAPPHAPAVPHVPETEPPRTVLHEIDAMLTGGVPIQHPAPELVAKARLAFEQGTATAGDVELLMRKAMADARTVLATTDLPHPSMLRDDWERFTYDLAALSWYNVRGQCGTGRDYVATSLGTLLMDADHPVVFQRFQAKEVFGVGKHAFAVVMVKDEPGWAFILDPTFAQFMRPPGRTLAMDEATANVLREHGTGAFMARDLLRDGFIPLTRENATLYARAMGAPEEQASAMGARLFHGEAAELTELVGGPERRPPVTHITSNDIETFSVQELQSRVAELVDELSGRGGGHQTERAQLADLQRRLDAAMQRGEVRPEAEGGPPAPPRPGAVPRTPVAPPTGVPETVPEPLSLPAVPIGPLAPVAPPRAAVAEAVGERFRGDLRAEAAISGSALTNAVEALGAAPGALNARLTPVGEGWPPSYSLRTRMGEVQVTVELTDAMPRRDAGVPVALAEPDAASGGYRVRVSSQAGSRVSVERALAGVLTELVAGHGVAELPDALRPGGSGGRLSAADEARLAQLDVLGRALARSQLPEARAGLQIEAEELVDATGLTGGSAAAASRREAALRHPELSEPARALLTQASESAATNPYLLSFTGERPHDMPLLEQALARIAKLESEEDARNWRTQLATELAQSLIDRRIVWRRRGRPVVEFAELGELLGLTPDEAARALSAPDNPVHALVAQARDIAVEGRAARTLMPSESRPPAPGFEAEIVSDRTGKLIPASASGEFPRGALTVDAAITPTGEKVTSLVQTRKTAMTEYGALKEELALKATPERRQGEIRDRLAVLDGVINAASEALGTEAGLAFARTHLPQGFVPVPIPRTGRDVPDLVFEHPDGRIVVIECKGGVARLGTRLDTSGRFLVQQGTIEYLRSLAATMAASDPGPIRALGERLQNALAGEQPRVEYYVVRQPLNPDGSLASPEYGRFDLHENERRP